MEIFALAFAPGIFWLWYFYKKDKLEPEPKGLLIKVYFLGLIIAFPAALVEFFIGKVFSLSDVLMAAVAAPVIEEYAKYSVVKRGVYKHEEFDEPMDGIVYAAAAALGFASIENVFYLLQARSAGIFTFVFLVRSLLSVPGHALFSSMWGYALGMAKFSHGDTYWKFVLPGLALSIALHGLFNFLGEATPLALLGLLILVPVMWKIVHRRIAQTLARSPHIVPPPETVNPTPPEPL